jgi:hypothetical protein
MRAKAITILCFLCVLVTLGSGCLRTVPDAAPPSDRAPERAEEDPGRLPIAPPTTLSLNDRSIRAVDFANFTYPMPTDDQEWGQRTIRLSGGIMDSARGPDQLPRGLAAFIGTTQYCDVTGDGVEDAITSLYISPSGGPVTYGVYIYTIRNRQPKLLWSFIANERGEGALRRVYAEEGKLVVELLGRDRVPGARTAKSPPPAQRSVPSPDTITRAEFDWRENRFELVAKELLPNPSTAPAPVDGAAS